MINSIYTDNFIDEAGDRILRSIQSGLRKNNRFTLCLSGGTTPRPVYTALARKGKDLSWDKVIITFSDERCVSPDSSDSNYRAARSHLFDHIHIPEDNILRMKGELAPADGAVEYEKQLDQTAKRLNLAAPQARD